MEKTLLIVFDLETTGLSKTTDEITQIALRCLSYKNEKFEDLQEKFSTFIQTKIEIPISVQTLTGILSFRNPLSQLRTAPTFPDAWKKILVWIKVIKLN